MQKLLKKRIVCSIKYIELKVNRKYISNLQKKNRYEKYQGEDIKCQRM